MTIKKQRSNMEASKKQLKKSKKELKYLCQKQKREYFKTYAKGRQKQIYEKQRKKLIINEIFRQKSDQIKTSIMDSDSNSPLNQYDHLFSLKKIKLSDQYVPMDRSFEYKKDLDVEVYFQPQPPIYYSFKKKQDKDKEKQKESQKQKQKQKQKEIEKQKEKEKQKPSKQKLRSFPVLQKTKDHKQSMFSLECDQPQLPQHVNKGIQDFERLVQKLVSRFQNTQIRVPKPTGTYCWVCRSHYQPEDYLTHIKSKYHQEKDESTQIWKDIRKIITKVNMQNFKNQKQKTNSQTTQNVVKLSSKQLFQQIQDKKKLKQEIKKAKKSQKNYAQKNNMDNYLKKINSKVQQIKSNLKEKQIETIQKTIQNEKSRSKSKQKRNSTNSKSIKTIEPPAVPTNKTLDFGLSKTRSAQKSKKMFTTQEQDNQLAKIQREMEKLKNKMQDLQKLQNKKMQDQLQGQK